MQTKIKKFVCLRPHILYTHILYSYFSIRFLSEAFITVVYFMCGVSVGLPVVWLGLMFLNYLSDNTFCSSFSKIKVIFVFFLF